MTPLERDKKIPHSTFSLWNNITRIGSFESSKQIRDSTLLRLPSFLYETFLHSLACLEHIKLSCRTPFTKICLFRGRFPTGILISQNRYLVWVYHTKLTKYTCDVRHTCQSSNWIEVFCFIIDWSEYHFKPYKTAENYRVRFVYYSRANTLLKLQSLDKLWDNTPINRKSGSLGNSKKMF